MQSTRSQYALSLLALSCITFSCTSETDREGEIVEDTTQRVESIDTTVNEETIDLQSSVDSSFSMVEQYTSEAYFTQDLGWGYRILNAGKPYINQPHIPAVSGMKGFDSEEDALSTAELAIYKIKNGIVPPTITKDDLDSLGVLN